MGGQGSNKSDGGGGGVATHEQMNKMFAQWAQGLTASEQNALNAYANGNAADIGVVQQALAKGSASRTLTIYHDPGKNFTGAETKAMVGKTFTGGVTGGTLQKMSGGSNTRFHITVPKGTPGGYLGAVTGSAHQTFVMPQGMSYKVTGTRTAGAYRIVNVTMVKT